MQADYQDMKADASGNMQRLHEEINLLQTWSE